MTALSEAQLTALARIRFSGLVYYASLAFLYEPRLHNRMATLHIATVRRLVKDGLIEPDPDPDIEFEDVWRVSRAGHAVLAKHGEYLAFAGREHRKWQGNYVLEQIGVRPPRG